MQLKVLNRSSLVIDSIEVTLKYQSNFSALVSSVVSGYVVKLLVSAPANYLSFSSLVIGRVEVSNVCQTNFFPFNSSCVIEDVERAEEFPALVWIAFQVGSSKWTWVGLVWTLLEVGPVTKTNPPPHRPLRKTWTSKLIIACVSWAH